MAYEDGPGTITVAGLVLPLPDDGGADVDLSTGDDTWPEDPRGAVVTSVGFSGDDSVDAGASDVESAVVSVPGLPG